MPIHRFFRDPTMARAHGSPIFPTLAWLARESRTRGSFPMPTARFPFACLWLV